MSFSLLFRTLFFPVVLALFGVHSVQPAFAQDEPQSANDNVGPTIDRVVEEAVSNEQLTDAVRAYLAAAPNANGLEYAAARIYRALANVSADERYDLLVEPVLTERSGAISAPMPTPTATPPVEFARAIRQRPTENVFAVPQVGSMKGLLWFEYELVRAAVDAGRAVDLSRRIESIENAELRQRWTRLLGIADEVQAQSEVDAWVAAIAKDWSQARKMSAVDVLMLWLASERDSRVQRWWLVDWVAKQANDTRPVWASEMMVQSPSRQSTIHSDRLAHWVVDAGPLGSTSECVVRQHGQHVWITGRETAARLWLRYPIKEFSEVSIEPFVGGAFDRTGQVGFAQRRIHATLEKERLEVRDLSGTQTDGLWCPFYEYYGPGNFHRLSVERNDEQSVIDVNRHPMVTQNDDRQFPWFDLSSLESNEALFRNFAAAGDSAISESVDLLAAGESAWTSPSGRSSEHWQFDDNVVHISSGPRTDVGWYRRPLADGEQVAFEVFAGAVESGATDSSTIIAAPVIGRTAFLISPKGVRVRWLTDAALQQAERTDWTTLAENHELLEPLSRRGPATLDIRTDDWNRVAVKRNEGNIELSLNDTLIYIRKYEPTAASHFGIYSTARTDQADEQSASMRIRNVELTGDWPNMLPEELTNDAFARASGAASKTADFGAKSVIKSEILAENYPNIRRQLAALPANEQFERLERWLFPGDRISRDTLIRMIGYVPPTDPSALAMADPAFASLNPNGVSPRVIHPVVDWVQLAIAHDFEDRIEARLAAAKATSPYESLAISMLRAIASAGFGSDEQLTASIEQMGKLLDKDDSSSPSRWSFLAFFSLVDEQDRWSDEISNLASDGFEKWSSTPDDDSTVIATHWMRLIAEHVVGGSSHSAELRRAHIVDRTGESANALVGGSRFNRLLRGNGRAKPLWVVTEDHKLVHRSGTDLDYLMLRTPMPASYAFHASGRAFTSIAMMQEGILFGADKENRYQRSIYSGQKLLIDWTPPGRMRSEVGYVMQKDGPQMQTFVNGAPLASEHVPDRAPPWVGVRAWWKSVAAVDHPMVRSEYEAPAAVDLSAPEQATFWSSYYQMKVGGEGSDWHWGAVRDAISADEDDPIRIESTQRGPGHASLMESLLTYNRPIVAGEQVDYRFYFEPGSYSASPAIGRTVLYVSENGVATHSITDGRYDRTNVDPGNMRQFEPWPSGTKLTAGWHDASVRLVEDRAILSIDNREVYDCLIDSHNDLHFGLFHYCDTSQLRVSGVRLTGDWPALSEYETLLDDPTLLSVERELAELPAKFEVDFSDRFDPGSDDRVRDLKTYFETRGTLSWTADGLRATARSFGDWQTAMIKPQFELHGDFDIRLSFTDLDNDEPQKTAGVRLEIDDDQTPSVGVNVARTRNTQNQQLASGAAKIVNPDGSTRYPGIYLDDISPAGTLRMVRVGNVVTTFFAPRETSLFRALRQQEVSPGPIVIGKLSCQVVASGRGTATVTFTSLSLKAERLRYTPSRDGRPPELMLARNLNTGDETTLAKAAGRLYHVGSPHISRDKKWVVYNRNDENPSNSRLEIVPLDGSQPAIDIGYGAVPRFSPDGTRIAFFAPGEGVGYCNRDGSERTIVSTVGDPADFPTNDTIAYVNNGQIWLHDINTGKTRAALTGPLEDRYSSFSWQINFGPDGKRVVVRGYRRDPRGREFALLDLENPSDITVLFKDASPLRPQAGWLNDGTYLFVGYLPGFPSSGLFIVDPEKPEEYRPFEYQPETIEPLDSHITPDREWIVVTGKQKPVPQEWTGR